MKDTKNNNEALSKLDRNKEYELNEAVKLLKDLSFAKFDESVEVAVNLGVDPRHVFG